ncbi:MAG: hypothetical protein H6644_17335 [Caldilineaceae bacterium]|nr:hypothetical protein [Caldilineaceae bacterium]
MSACVISRFAQERGKETAAAAEGHEREAAVVARSMVMARMALAMFMSSVGG